MENESVNDFVGTGQDDQIVDGYEQNPSTLRERLDQVDKANGHAGNDTISTGEGDDLAAGDMVGQEWQFIDGKWVYDAGLIQQNNTGYQPSYDDVIHTGSGRDVLLGNGGNDQLFAGAGNDLINAGNGNDRAFGESGDDLINLENGDDYAEGGTGSDTINAGAGDDLVYGDLNGGNLLSGQSTTATSFSQLAETSGWAMTDVDGQSQISQSVGTVAGDDYTISFELAANLAAGHDTGKVEVLWNGEVVDTIEAQSGVFERHEVNVTSQGEEGALSFRAIQPEDSTTYNFDGPIISYEKGMTIGGQEVTVDAFAPGQAALYQVIDGHLKKFDVEAREYVDVGDNPGFKINATGFNVEDDLIYGVAKSNGVDALGNPVKTTDIVMIDASGDAFRIGAGRAGHYVGDFDNEGNLWSFNGKANYVDIVDVDKLDANGNPVQTRIDLPNDMFKDNAFDMAFSAEENAFYAVVSPSSNGGAGKVVRFDLSSVQEGGVPSIREIPITGTLYGDQMDSGMAKGAYGAVFMDGDGNLYYGLNRGDHDLDGSTGAQGGIYKVNVDWSTGQAYSEFMSEAQSTGSNDGAVDPRSLDAFATVDAEAAVLLRNPEIISEEAGNDNLRGGDGKDEMYGNGGDDTLFGGNDDDTLSGDDGNDKLFGGQGNDTAAGGEGKDTIMGGAGDDLLDGGNNDDKLFGGSGADTLAGGSGNDKLFGESEDDHMSGNDGNDTLYAGKGDDTAFGGSGNDFVSGGAGNDLLSGGAGNDKIVGGTGSDTIVGGAGNDHLWGGQWSGDNASDTFVASAGSGKDIIHDFEADKDQVDLSSYGLDYADLQNAIRDHGWAVEIDLAMLKGGQTGDRLFLKSVDADDLNETNFIL